MRHATLLAAGLTVALALPVQGQLPSEQHGQLVPREVREIYDAHCTDDGCAIRRSTISTRTCGRAMTAGQP